MRLIMHNLGNFLSHRDVKVIALLLPKDAIELVNGKEVANMIFICDVINLTIFYLNYVCQDLVQSALLESNTGRDDRILYNKLVRMGI